jgi:branched-chain amino acid transport system substrate-binding protein
MQQGIELAVDEVNAAGGINGAKLDVIVEDSRSDNRGGVDAANKLVSINKVKAIETGLTGITKSITPITERNRVLLFTCATAPGLTDDCKYVFRNATNVRNEADKIIAACRQRLGIDSMALIWLNNPVGVWASQYFRQQFEAKGGRLVASESFQPDATDMRTQLEKIRVAAPAAIYIVGYQQSGLIMKQARELGMTCQFLGMTDFELPDVLKAAGTAAEGAVYTKASFDTSSKSMEVAKYVKAYAQRFGEDPEVYSATMYDATHIIAKAMTASGGDPDKARQFILAIKQYPGASGLTSFMPNGDVEKPVELKKIQGGKPTVISE